MADRTQDTVAILGKCPRCGADIIQIPGCAPGCMNNCGDLRGALASNPSDESWANQSLRTALQNIKDAATKPLHMEIERLRALVDKAEDLAVHNVTGCGTCTSVVNLLVGGAVETPGEQRLTLDTDRQVFFYEQDHYYLSNFSAFAIHWRGQAHFTSEHAYHWSRFDLPEGRGELLQDCVQRCGSAHLAFKFAQENKSKQREDWDDIKVDVMRDILRAKAKEHEYVHRKLLQTGDRELIENSWRDSFWGWGPNRDGQNMLGKLWMDVRAELRDMETGGER